ncbi:MAG: LEA type 2 family protein [Thermotogae bacterium]|nr:LEA type 2 family protein [Thermotogota bacterium]
MLRFVAITALVSVTLMGCSAIQKRVALKDCKFSLEGVELKRISRDGFGMDVLVKVSNPNDVEAVVDRFLGQVSLDDVKVADVSISYKSRIPAKSSKTLPVGFSVRYSDLKEAASKVMNIVLSRRAKVSVSGKAYVDYDLPLIGTHSVSYPVRLSRSFSF